MGYIRLTHCLFVLSALLCGMSVNGQSQHGYVKTIGRPNQKGMPLSGVSVRVKGEHNPVLSNENGFFSMLMTSKRNGDAYTLQEVQKKGYELNETSVIGRQYAYSDRVPLTIVMVSSSQLQADKQRIENNAYQVAERNYKTKLDLLEKQKTDNVITEEQYRKELFDLQDKFEKYQLLIDGLAEHYAHVDYDELNDKEREVNICIENGELERADSLVKTLFDPIDVLKRNKEALAELNQQILDANTVIDKANEDMAAVLKQQEKDANYLYQLYTIALANFDNEKAQKYIMIRAELDSTNILFQKDAIDFLSESLSDYDGAEQIAQRMMRTSVKKFGFNSQAVAECVTYFSSLSNYRGEYDNAIKYAQEVLEKCDTTSEAYQEAMVGAYLSLAYANSEKAKTYKKNNDFKTTRYLQDVSFAYCLKALNVCQKWDNISKGVLGESYYGLATYIIQCASSCGYRTQLYYDYIDQASIYYKKALKEWENLPSHLNRVAVCHMMMASVPLSKGYNDLAIIEYEKAIKLLRQAYGDRHRHIATCLVSMGAIAANEGDRKKSLEYYKEAYQIRKDALGENNSETQKLLKDIKKDEAFLRSGLSSSYDVNIILSDYLNKKKSYEETFDILYDLQELLKKSDDDDMTLPLSLYQTAYIVSMNEKDFEHALQAVECEMEILESINDTISYDYAFACLNAGSLYSIFSKDYSKALFFFDKSLSVHEKMDEQPNVDQIALCDSIANMCLLLEYVDKASFYMLKRVDILAEILGIDNPNVNKQYLQLAEYNLKIKNFHNYLMSWYNYLLGANNVGIEELDSIVELSEEYMKDNPHEKDIIEQYEKIKQKYKIK